ncbi:MAG TPA: hypothetical protein VMP01_04760 [Pirellulaceae bacterium]|nr:hypothetical protein [Pirellulaceae bacterium]
MLKTRVWKLALCSLTLVLLFAGDGILLAQNGGKKSPGGGGGGGSEPPPAGRIHFLTDGTDADGNRISVGGSMLADGSGKQLSELRHPSYLLHGGERWFLDAVMICLEQDAEGNCSRFTGEIIAARESDGLEIQLTNNPDVFAGVNSRVRWAKDDSFVSFVGRHDADGDGLMDEDSIFAAGVDFDADGKPFLTAAPVAVTTHGLDDHLGKFDWSPDATRLVYMLGKKLTSSDPPPVLVVEDLLAGTAVPLDFGRDPEWSPNGSKIAYQWQTDNGNAAGIATIAPDGTGYVELTTPDRNTLHDEKPVWSPDSGHLAFTRVWISNKGGSTSFFEDILRISATGGKTTNLTEDIDNAFTLGWR